MYCYEREKHKIFTEDRQKDFLKVRNTAKILLKEAGAFKILKACKNISGEAWLMMAYVDRLVELGEIKEITKHDVAGQDRVFVEANV